ncbi:hypothetical protein [Mesorhizobium sp. M7A.F.Ca.MR.362.00.0.0]|uniref:hypothetical protein n=1 Tax=Mesorhizobium sp. M7A.F.Ca.MR.362.00.0.0 TaxID=2496779 RepID=UPI000FD2A952|nr:hypothetical protein [Mesorhizobium sp. M7A.F.Ca.MR.362.00.0.0]RUU81298.1 hypothetical protein EOC06_08820 [Mesorhizobium sp. M7A.F.Ca.MR.362.00.0.0]
MTPILVRDLLMNMLLGLTALVVLVLAQINPEAKPNPDTLPPPGNIAVLMCWAPGPTDVDLWLGAPGDKSVGYSRKSGFVWALLRDDMGIVNDVSPINCESAFARATPAGEYVINIHGYSLPETMPVHIEVSMNGSLLVSTNLDLRPKQERTVVRLTLDGKGSIIPGSQSTVFKELRSAA